VLVLIDRQQLAGTFAFFEQPRAPLRRSGCRMAALPIAGGIVLAGQHVVVPAA
jgi:hypothetical protein